MGCGGMLTQWRAVPAESIAAGKRLLARSLRRTPSAMGERQMFAVHTNRIRGGIVNCRDERIAKMRIVLIPSHSRARPGRAGVSNRGNAPRPSAVRRCYHLTPYLHT